MILLLAGSSPVVRSALAEKICSGSEQWRHLAIEDLADAARESEGGKEYDELKLLAIVVQCANTMQKEGYHMILSLSDATDFSAALREHLEGDHLSIYLGDPKPSLIDAYDHVIDTSAASVNDIVRFLQPLIEDPPDA